MTKLATVLAAVGMLAVGLTARAEVRLQGGGASFPKPIYERWVSEYQKLHPDVKIDYGAIGSGGGIKGITDKTFDFAGSDAPMTKKEFEKVGGPPGMVEIPTVGGAVVMAFNLPGVTKLNLDGNTIAEIYLQQIKNWNDPKIAALNPSTKLPDQGITTVHRTDGSGTNSIFTNYLCTQNQTFNNKIGSGKSVEWPKGSVGGAQNQGVTQIVQTTRGAIGYIELAYAIQNKLTFATVKNKDGRLVKATAESVALAGEAAAAGMHGNILAANIWDQPGPNAYPISSFTYIIVYKDLGYLKDPAKARALAEFLRWATTDGEKMAASMDYAPLSPAVQQKVAAALDELTWEGKKIALVK